MIDPQPSPFQPALRDLRASIAKWMLCTWFALAATSPVLCQDKTEPAAPQIYQPTEDVKDALTPLFSRINKADVSRATVELSAETVFGGQVVETIQSTYQIASKYPSQYTIYFKSDEDRKRLYSNGKESVVAVAPDAYYKLPTVYSCQDLATESIINLGPYPEVVMALTLAGVDPSLTFLGAMKSVEVIGQAKFRGGVDAVQLRGVQDDGVKWDLWISTEDKPRPLRLLVDLTPMLIATGQVAVPDGYAYSLRFDFKTWRVTGEVEDKLFRYVPPTDATEYASNEDYRRKLAAKIGEHPLLGKQVPDFELTLLDGSKISRDDLQDKVVVLDFWATWCGPCLQAMPVIAQSVQKYADKDVVFYAVNVAENTALVRGFVSEQDWNVDVATDPDGDLVDSFAAKSIPLTLLIARTGIVEAAHVGFPGEQELSDQFDDELSVLTQNGRIASSKESEEKQ